ncbi:MAG: excinuclease ABC subunit UvrA [Kiritimatiellia bacterium]
MSGKDGSIVIRGARQNNLKGLDLDIGLHQLTVITGVSGSGKSSLAFDTIYAEGQRRYVETFSPYARQFLERMDKPVVDQIRGIPPAVAIDQTNPVRTSRSTVGTMTELNDHLKLLFARAARLICQGCGVEVLRDTPEHVVDCAFRDFAVGTRLTLVFPVLVPEGFPLQEVLDALRKQGYDRVHERDHGLLEVVQDRVVLRKTNRGRLLDSVSAAYRHGNGRVTVQPEAGTALHYSEDLHCASCDLHYREASPNLFSFNSPVGACEHCRGFGRTIGVDYDLVIPDPSLSLRAGAIRPWQSSSYQECQQDMVRFARKARIALDTPWRSLSESQRRWVIEGAGRWEDGAWYGVQGFFDWLESKSYKMHIRVMLSKYRAYRECEVCRGARLKAEALWWRLGSGAGMHIQDVMLLPLSEARDFFHDLVLPEAPSEAIAPLLHEIRSRLHFLCEAGLGYLTLDRQSRTLSGGEVQRINLTTALGTTLVNTLFVLDEPTIGLHARDTSRIIGILKRLRDAGNTLLVVEHDPDVIQAADCVIDIGPGAGAHGGEIVYTGSVSGLLASKASVTGAYLRGEKKVADSIAWLPTSRRVGSVLAVRGAAENNLRHLDIDIPLQRLVCFTGVSGSGKSTLLETCIYRGLQRLRGEPVDSPGRLDALHGGDAFAKVVLIDQHALGKTTRSNPASYTGAWQAIRAIFAKSPEAEARGYKPGTFSFNSGLRCEACGGNGFQRVEMQFLSDVYLRCSVCDGTRFQSELLDVRIDLAGHPNMHVADVLDMPIDTALEAFADYPAVCRALQPLVDTGLGYVRLGQPVTTLSGGEAQRLKLAAYLQEAQRDAAVLFILDEPTTGLHMADVAILVQALRALVMAGHSVFVIEHHLDVIRASDWIVDLGPEGGSGGGMVLFEGPPSEIVGCEGSFTGRVLAADAERGTGLVMDVMRQSARQHGDGWKDVVETPPALAAESGVVYGTDSRSVIRVQGAREHNLKNIDVVIPQDAFTVITGLSGSGKSTVAFDILYREGQRRYLDSLHAYARQFVQPAARPDVDAVNGVPPTVAIEQRISRGGLKSTVATITEIYHFMRLLFAKLGVQHCPDCHIPVTAQSVAEIMASIQKAFAGARIGILVPLVQGRKGIYRDLAQRWANRGFRHLRVDGHLVPLDPWPRLDRYREHDIDLPLGELRCRKTGDTRLLQDLVSRALDVGSGHFQVEVLGAGGASGRVQCYSSVRSCAGCGRSFPEPDPRLFSFHSSHGWCESCCGTGIALRGFDAEQTGEEEGWIPESEHAEPCRDCGGRRLRIEALSVYFRERSIVDYTAKTVAEAALVLRRLQWQGAAEKAIGESLRQEMASRLDFLQETGLGYLTLDRAAPTLSGGEAQRIRLAAQLGSNLCGVCYVLDEPTIGLHPRDNDLLIESLRKLQRKGNTVVVVEHDEDTIRQADHVIDLGPGAGTHGGRVVAQGTPAMIMQNPASVTGQSLAKFQLHPIAGTRRACGVRSRSPVLHVKGASLHNLRSVNARFPLGRLVCVSGVSGSGKSTLVHDVLLASLVRKDGGVTGCREIVGREHVRQVLEVDQTPIGRTPRSCPATYVGFWDAIRRLLAAVPDARMRGWAASYFSFNTGEGRCPVCKGNGYMTVEMSFLPDVQVRCEACNGRRFTAEAEQVRYRDKSVADLLLMSVDEALPVFSAHPGIVRPLQLMRDVGLGYITLGQHSPTLSGGEAQRIKLVSELARRSDRAGTLYILDEPTIGLHAADVEHLIRVLHVLVDSGATVVVIEHHAAMLAEADWVIDLGPEGGAAGGRIVFQGTPEGLAGSAKSYTGRYVKPLLAG